VNLRLTLAYDGTRFRGWARQPGLRTVEQVLADALAATFASAGPIAVAGRTDTGVHALAQVVSVTVTGGPPADVAARVLTGILPEDLAVLDARAVDPSFHARHAARARTYRYRVRTASSRAPLDARRALHHPRRLRRDVLDHWAAAVIGSHDFRAFTPAETQHVDFVRTVESARWVDVGDEVHFEITADRFLRHQVRTLVGTMLHAARSTDGVDPSTLLVGAPRAAAGPTAPPWGLYLVGVHWAQAPSTHDGAEA
jgi:tRNA pseudouridine38-40 synthase